MWKILSCVIAALCGAILIGGQVFVLLTALDWAILEGVGLHDHSMVIGAAIAALPSLVVAIWIARSGYRVEMGFGDNDGSLTP